MLPIKLRIVLAIALLIYFILILAFLKRKAIELKYTLLWILAGVFMTSLVVFPSVLPKMLKVLGIVGNMNGLFIILIGFLMVLSMSLTSIVSKQTVKIRQLTQSIAILEREIRILKKVEEDDK